VLYLCPEEIHENNEVAEIFENDKQLDVFELFQEKRYGHSRLAW
jgi:hypothetical protein